MHFVVWFPGYPPILPTGGRFSGGWGGFLGRKFITRSRDIQRREVPRGSKKPARPHDGRRAVSGASENSVYKIFRPSSSTSSTSSGVMYLTTVKNRATMP